MKGGKGVWAKEGESDMKRRRRRRKEEEEEKEEDFRAPFVRTSSHVLCTKEVGQGWKGGGGGEEEVEKRRFVMPGSRGQLIIS